MALTSVNTPHFASLLDEAPDHVEFPKAIPQGTYLCTVGAPLYGKSSKKGTPFVEFQLKILSPMDDVDAEALEEAGGCGGKTLRATYYTTEDAIYRLDEFHEHCGLDLESPATRRTRNDMVVNSQVLAYVKNEEEELDQDALANGVVPRIFARLNRTAPAE